MKQTIRTKLQSLNHEAVLFDDWADCALIGICSISTFAPVALYSKQKIYAALKERKIDKDDMEDYYASRFANIRAGEFTPIIFDDLEE